MTDPVCGMQVDPANAAGTSAYRGHTYSFCSKGRQANFDANPRQFTAPTEAPRDPCPPPVPRGGVQDAVEYSAPRNARQRCRSLSVRTFTTSTLAALLL
jgi:Cu+-exporting ATPase